MRNEIVAVALAASTVALPALAKLPPLSDDAKAKAAEAAAKAAHAGKVASFQLCKSMDQVAARYIAEAAKAGKTVKPTETPACVDPGPAVAATPAPAAAPAPAAPAAPAKKS